MIEDTIVGIATPAGMGGLAVVRISGEKAYAVADAVFFAKDGVPLQQSRGYVAHYGTFQNGGQAIDEGIALCFHAPHSYTGEELVECSCHGGNVVSEALLHSCIQAGARPAQPGEYTKRAVLNGRISLTQAEAVQDIIAATSLQGVALSRQVMRGQLYQEIEAMKDRLLAVCAHMAASLDFPEEDVAPMEGWVFLDTIQSVLQTLTLWISSFGKGMMLRRGIQTAIVGAPNVGKSTIFNRLLGQDRSIVTSKAGTTRDVVREQVRLAGMTLQLADTAGIRSAQDTAEQQGISRAKEELSQAALILAIYDGSIPLNEEDLALAKACSGRAAIALINKSDLGQCVFPLQLDSYFEKVLVVNAFQEDLFLVVEKAVEDVLRWKTTDGNALLLANERQLAAAVAAQSELQEVLRAVDAKCTPDILVLLLQQAIEALLSLQGKNVSDEVIDSVFENFCVGK